MGYIPYVGFAIHHRAIVRIHLYLKRLMIMQMICIKKKMGRHSRTYCFVFVKENFDPFIF
jgi:hypothetical protein